MSKINLNFKILIFLLLIIILYFSILYILKLDINDYNKSDLNYTTNNNFNYSEYNWIKILDLKGSDYYSKWFYHWKNLTSEINELLDYFKNDLLLGDKKLWRPLYSLLNYKAKKFLKYIPENYILEMKWIADWSWVSFNDILLINTYDDLLNIAGCSSMILPIREDFNDTFYHTRNLDYDLGILSKNKILFKYDSHISVWFPWYIWVLSWVWEKWISLSSHTSYSNDLFTYWLPTWLLYRKVIEQSNNLSESKYIISNSVRTIPNIIVLWSYKENDWIILDVTTNSIWTRNIIDTDKWLVWTNYFLSKELYDPNITFWEDRYNQYINLLFNTKRISLDFVKKVISYYDPEVKWWWTIANRWTVQSVIMEPSNRKLFIANWDIPPVTNWDFVEIYY